MPGILECGVAQRRATLPLECMRAWVQLECREVELVRVPMNLRWSVVSNEENQNPGPCTSDCNAVLNLPFHAVPVPFFTFGKPDESTNPLTRTHNRKFIASPDLRTL